MPEVIGVDGCVMIIVQDVMKDPAKEHQFIEALTSNRDNGIPPHIAATRALNANGAGLPELDESVLRSHLVGPIGDYFARTFDRTLPTYPGIGLAFLNLLAETAESRIAILKGEYKPAVDSQ